MYHTNDPYKFIRHIKKLSLLRIFVQSDVISLCALKMFTTILKKEMIKHEIVFVNEDTLLDLDTEFYYITSDIEDDKENTFNNLSFMKIENLINSTKRLLFGEEVCFCCSDRLDILYNMYKLLKHSSFIDEGSLWALIVGFSFYKIYLYKKSEEVKDDSEEDNYYSNSSICTTCNEMYTTICIEIKKLDREDKDGIFLEYDVSLPILNYSNLYRSIQHDVYFIAKYKLIYKKRKDLEDIKIKSFLAKKGISIVKAKEKYNNLDHTTKKYISSVIDTCKIFIRKKGHTHKITSIDCYFLMNRYLFKNQSAEAYLLLNNPTGYFNDKKINDIYDSIQSIKDSIAYVSKVDKLLIFKLSYKNILNINSYIKFAYNMIDLYKRERQLKYSFILMLDKFEISKCVVYGKQISLSNINIDGIVKIDKQEFLRNLVDDK